MSGSTPGSGEWDAMAAEYVLGTADARTALRVMQAVAIDPRVRDMVEAWEQRLYPLMMLATPEAPPPGLWERIEGQIAPPRAAIAAAAPKRFRLRFLWQGWAVGATLVAAGLAAVMVLPSQSPAPPAMMTVLLSDATQTAWTAEVNRDGGIHLAALQAAGGASINTAPPDDKVLQLWQLPPGATAPTSLGLVPRGQSQVSVERPAIAPVPGMLILISLEPKGGAPNGLPTGPVLFVGKLSPAGPQL
jgi:anti-sigma-K factor RskA